MPLLISSSVTARRLGQVERLHHQLRPADDLERVVRAAALGELADLGDGVGVVRVNGVGGPCQRAAVAAGLDGVNGDDDGRAVLLPQRDEDGVPQAA
jgi:hypothetical protein